MGKLGVEHLVLSLGLKKHCIIPLVHDHLVWFICGSKIGWQVAFVGVEHGLYSEANAKSDHYDYPLILLFLVLLLLIQRPC